MANRHLLRSVALQSLFEWDFNQTLIGREISIDDIVKRQIAEFAPGAEDKSFTQELASGVLKEQPKLDRIITKAASEWPLEQIALTDRNVLRLGLYELLFVNRGEVPARVAINEAIELAKTFGGERSGKFVNGVLGTVYKEMGEPGRHEITAKKKRVQNVPYKDMPVEKLAGAVIYTKTGEHVYLALVHDVFGFWTLSKGHLNDGEAPEAGTVREAREEISLEIVAEDFLGQNEYIASDPEKGKVRKQVSYYLASAPKKDSLKLAEDKGGLDGAEWFSLEEVGQLKMYDDIVPIIAKAIKKLSPLLRKEKND